MFEGLRRRRPVLTAVELTHVLNRSLRRASRSWLQPRPADQRAGLVTLTDFQRPLAEAYHDHTHVLADVHDLAAASRTNLPDTPEGRTAKASLDWAVYLLGQAEVALRQAAVDTCPDAARLPARRV